MAKACLTYLNYQQVKALSDNPASKLQEATFLKYPPVY